MIYLLLANTILVFHIALVLFNVGGLLIVWIGALRGWPWVRNFWFRLAHLLSMGLVALQTMAGLFCVLTVWEDRLRELAGGQARYHEACIPYWLHRLFFFDLPPWVFNAAYVSYFLLVVLTLWLVPPRAPWRKTDGRDEPRGPRNAIR